MVIQHNMASANANRQLGIRVLDDSTMSYADNVIKIPCEFPIQGVKCHI